MCLFVCLPAGDVICLFSRGGWGGSCRGFFQVFFFLVSNAIYFISVCGVSKRSLFISSADVVACMVNYKYFYGTRKKI